MQFEGVLLLVNVIAGFELIVMNNIFFFSML